MNVSATLNGESVAIVQVEASGGTVVVTYVDSASQLRVKKLNYPMGGTSAADEGLYIASAATIG